MCTFNSFIQSDLQDLINIVIEGISKEVRLEANILKTKFMILSETNEKE